MAIEKAEILSQGLVYEVGQALPAGEIVTNIKQSRAVGERVHITFADGSVAEYPGHDVALFHAPPQ